MKYGHPRRVEPLEALPLWAAAGPAARATDPETSHTAADRKPSVRAHDRAKVLQAHAEHPDGLTDFELAKLVGRKQTSAGKRRGELRDEGLIEQTKMRRDSDTNSPAIVWRITAAGIALARGEIAA